MKNLLKILVFVVLGIVLMGAFQKGDMDKQIVCYKVSIKAGQGMDYAASKYYDENTDGRSWQEFRHDVMNANKHLVANGRMLQPGDVVVVEVRK